MKDDPEIIKELREAEKLGKLKSKSQKTYEKKASEKTYEKGFMGTVNIYKNPLKNLEKNVNLEDIEDSYHSIFENYYVAITIADENERIISS